MPLNFLTILITFLQAGGLTIGDGYATISPLRRALVKKNGWISEDDFSRHLAVVNAMPGIFNVNMAAYMGQRLMGWRGSAAAHRHDAPPTAYLHSLCHLLYRHVSVALAIQTLTRNATRHRSVSGLAMLADVAQIANYAQHDMDSYRCCHSHRTLRHFSHIYHPRPNAPRRSLRHLCQQFERR